MNTLDITDLSDADLDFYLASGFVRNPLAWNQWADIPGAEFRTEAEAEAEAARLSGRGQRRAPCRVREVRYLNRTRWAVQARQF